MALPQPAVRKISHYCKCDGRGERGFEVKIRDDWPAELGIPDGAPPGDAQKRENEGQQNHDQRIEVQRLREPAVEERGHGAGAAAAWAIHVKRLIDEAARIEG